MIFTVRKYDSVAYIYTIEETGEQVAYVVDACHSLLYHN